MIDLVLDSYALLEWLLGQPKADIVQRYLDEATCGVSRLWMSWINVGEVIYMLARKRGIEAAHDFEKRLPALPVRFMMPDVGAVLGAAHAKATARISYADAFAVQLAVSQKARIVTGDPEIAALKVVQVCWVGPDRESAQ